MFQNNLKSAMTPSDAGSGHVVFISAGLWFSQACLQKNHSDENETHWCTFYWRIEDPASSKDLTV